MTKTPSSWVGYIDETGGMSGCIKREERLQAELCKLIKENARLKAELKQWTTINSPSFT